MRKSIAILSLICLVSRCITQPVPLDDGVGQPDGTVLLDAGSPRQIDENGKIGYIEGFVTHGANILNGRPITDFVSDGFGFAFNDGFYQQQVLNVNGDNAILPDETTDRNGLLSTGRSATQWFIDLGLPVTPNEALFNIQYNDVGTSTVASISIDNRFQLSPFDEAPDNPSQLFPNSYHPKGANIVPTLGDWETASGLIEIICDEYDNSAIIKVTVCNMLPSALYTIWEAGVINPGPEERVYFHPAGGAGNVIRTNLNGYGTFEAEMPWCPLRECEAGKSLDCQLYFSVFHHPDYYVYGAAPAATAWKPISFPPGIVGSSHLYFPVRGTLLQEPLNRFDKRKCKRKYKPYKKNKNRKGYY